MSTPYAITARYTSSIKGKGGGHAIVLPWSESLLARVYTARYKFYGRAIIGNLVNWILLEEEFGLGINSNFYVDYLYSEQKQGYYFSEMIRSNGWRNVW